MSLTVRMADGDLEIGNAGEQTYVKGSEKAAQDLLDEIFLPYNAERDRGNELFEPDGSLTSLAGSISVGSSAIRSMLKSAVQRLMQAQQRDAFTDPEEVIREVTAILVQAVNNDPTQYAFFLSVSVRDQAIAVARAITTRHLGNTPRPLVGGYDP